MCMTRQDRARHALGSKAITGQGRAGHWVLKPSQDRAGQGREGQGRTEQGKTWKGRAEQSRVSTPACKTLAAQEV